MEIGANRLRDELKRQLVQSSSDEPQVAGIVTVGDLGADYPSALQSLDRQVAELSCNSEDTSWADVPLHDHSLLWKISGFSGSSPCFLDPEFMNKRIKSIHRVPSDPIRTYTDDVWRNPRLSSWLTSDTSSLLLVQGNFDSAARLALFGADLAEHADKQQPLAYVSCAPIQQNSGSTPFRLTAVQVLRHIAIQALRKVAHSVSVRLLIETVSEFGSATTSEDWFRILQKVLSRVFRLYVVIHLGTRQVVEEAQNWPHEFQALLEKLRTQSPQTIIRVIIISCRSFGLLKSSGTTAIISVGRPDLPPDHIRSLPKQRVVIPKGLLRLPGAECMEKSNNATCRDDNDTLTVSQPVAEFDVGAGWTELTPAHSTADKSDSRPKDRRDFEIAIFCALPREADAVVALLDQHWDRREYGKGACDPNSYTLGAIGIHNVVLVHLPGMGKGIAASAASSCHTSFTGIKLALVVGICGGVPFGPDHTERILGDVVISDGLVQYDFGRQFPDQFMRKNTLHDSLSRPNPEIRGFLARLGGRQARLALLDAVQGHLTALHTCKDSTNESIYKYPGIGADVLYEPSYPHKHRDASQCPAWPQTCGRGRACDVAKASNCEALTCDNCQLVPRQRLLQPAASQLRDTGPGLMVHIGTIASGDKVMKSGEERDRLARNETIIAFEMEGAGVWDHFPCLIIKGICDYADCHKSKKWQDYATATAAACMKAVLGQWD